MWYLYNILGGSLKCVEALIDSLHSLTREVKIEFPSPKFVKNEIYDVDSQELVALTGTPFECAKAITRTKYCIMFQGKNHNIFMPKI